MLLASPADVSRLARKRLDTVAERDPTKTHTTCAISDGNENPAKILMFYHGEADCQLLILVKLWSENRMFQFFC
jgi:hypothetical protein